MEEPAITLARVLAVLVPIALPIFGIILDSMEKKR